MKDNGVGTPPQNVQKLFEPLFALGARHRVGTGCQLEAGRGNGSRIEVQGEAGRVPHLSVLMNVNVTASFKQRA